jgi:type III restriction enzyme
MAFQRKVYQETALEILEDFLKTARVHGAKTAFERATEEKRQARTYKPLQPLPETPYICLRIPTGGGKTYMATRSAAIAANTFLEDEYPIILWLVPTNVIRQQTLETLKKPEHPNHEALMEAFKGQVKVLDITEFTQIRPQDLRDRACVVVGTFASLRVKDTDGRKVYAHNEYLEPHFATLPTSLENLELIDAGIDKGKPKYSFRNLLTIHRPLVIVDESQNAATSLMHEVFIRIQPECVFEFTATPTANSNILYNVSASQLKHEQMIKLPIVLTEHPNWEDAIENAILTRQKLAELAKKEPDFVRPIVLIQAEEKGREVTVEVVEKFLLEPPCNLKREQIAIATGTQRELDGINLFDRDCKIEVVITIEALKEGWDCSFAYVFCSVATVHSKKDVEQLLGRVLRMPYATERVHTELNRAYAHVSQASWTHATEQMEDRLVDMGFDKLEAAQNTLAQSSFWNDEPITYKPQEPIVFVLNEEPNLSNFDLVERSQLKIETGKDNCLILRVSGTVSPELEKKIIASVQEQDRTTVSQTIAQYHQQPKRPLSPAERGEPFVIPQLSLWLDGVQNLAEYILDDHLWNLLDYPAKLDETDFSIEEKATSYEFDIKGEKLTYKFLGKQLPLDFGDTESSLTDLQLSRWLASRLRELHDRKNVRYEDFLEFSRKVLAQLTQQRKIPLVTLVRARFQLLKAMALKIKDYQLRDSKTNYQALLFHENTTAETTYNYSFNFDPKSYPANSLYQGRYEIGKHYYGNMIGAFENDEEMDCARDIAQCDDVKYWVRNLVHDTWGFRLPLSNGKFFYPDFVAMLNDGRIFVIEYKGEHLVEYSQEKKNIGELWEEKSNGKALFLMAVKRDEKGRSVYKQIEDKIRNV